MSSDKIDRRIPETEKLIESAFLRIKKEKPFDKISITDVCREAGISRSTFYERYGTMEELLNKTIDHILENLPPMEKSVNAYRWSKLKSGPPLCIYIRTHPETHGLFYDPLMHNIIVDRKMLYFSTACSDIMSEYGDIPKEQYDNLLKYQTFGCLAMMTLNADKSDEEWEKTKRTIDDMILINLNNHTV